LLPGIVESWGAAFDQIKQFIQNVINKVQELLDKIGEALRSIPGMQPSSREDAETLLERMKASGNWPGYAAGGYTGDGPANEVAGVVHRGEFVLSQDMLRALGSGGGMGGGRKIAETVNVYADTREGGFAAADGFAEQLAFNLRS
jgi:phage-related minor tail protein